MASQFTSKDKVLAILPKISSVFSLCGSVAILSECFYFERNRLKRVYNRLLCTMALFDILESIWNFISSWAIPEGRAAFAVGNELSCTVQGFFLQLGLTSPILNAFLSWYYLLVIRYNWSEEKIKEKAEPWIYGVSLLIGFGTSVAAIPLNLYYPSGFWCWIANDQWDPNEKKDPTNNFVLYRYLFYFGPLFACFFVIAFCMALLVITVRRLENASKKYLASSYAQKARDRNKRERKVLKTLRSTLGTRSKRPSVGDRVKRESVGDPRMQDLLRKQEEVRQKRLSQISTSTDNPTADDASRILSMRKSRNQSLNSRKSVSFLDFRQSASSVLNASGSTRNSASSFISSGAIAYLRKTHSASLTSSLPGDGNNPILSGQSQLIDKPDHAKEKAAQNVENPTFEANDGKITVNGDETILPSSSPVDDAKSQILFTSNPEDDFEAQIPRASDDSEKMKVEPNQSSDDSIEHSERNRVASRSETTLDHSQLQSHDKPDILSTIRDQIFKGSIDDLDDYNADDSSTQPRSLVESNSNPCDNQGERKRSLFPEDVKPEDDRFIHLFGQSDKTIKSSNGPLNVHKGADTNAKFEFPIGLNRRDSEDDEPKSFRPRTDYSIGEPMSFMHVATEDNKIHGNEVSSRRQAFRESKCQPTYSQDKTGKKRKKRKTKSRMVTEQALFYVLSFLITFIWSIIRRFYNLAPEVTTPYVISMGNAFFDPLQGFVNFLVYIRPKLISYSDRHPEKTFIQCMQALIMHVEADNNVDLDKEAEEGAKKELTRWRKMQKRMSVSVKDQDFMEQSNKPINLERSSIASIPSTDGEIDKMLVEEEEMED